MDKKSPAFASPENILSQLDIQPDMKLADFGCGHGHFTIPMAVLVGEKGEVYALDVVKETLEAVKNKAELEGISNIKIIHCNLEILGSSKLEDNSIDLVLIRNVLFQSQKKSEIVREARRILKHQGRLALIEWQPKASLAPRDTWLISKEQVQNLAETEGLVFNKELGLDEQHYGLVFVKP